MTATPGNGQERVSSAATLLSGMWNYASSVLYPGIILKKLGLYVPEHIGNRPPLPATAGLGTLFSRSCPFPVLQEERLENNDLVEEFDRFSQNYEGFTRTLTTVLLEEAIKLVNPYLMPSSRVLSTNCQTGIEAMTLALLVSEGEVLAADPSAKKVQAAFEQARCTGIGNMAFFQADVAALPEGFTNMFDAIYCSLAFYPYLDPIASVREMYRALRPGGYAFVVNPGQEWFKRLTGWIAVPADPDWVGFHNRQEIQALFLGVGFSSYYWEELLPGIGLVISRK